MPTGSPGVGIYAEIFDTLKIGQTATIRVHPDRSARSVQQAAHNAFNQHKKQRNEHHKSFSVKIFDSRKVEITRKT